MSGGGAGAAPPRGAPRCSSRRPRLLLAAALLLALGCTTAAAQPAPPLRGAALERAIERWRATEYALQVGERNQRWLEGSLDATLIEDEASQDKMAWETDVPAAELVAQLAVQRAALDALRQELEMLRAQMDAVWPPGREGENGSVSVGVAGGDEVPQHAALAARMAAAAVAGRRASSRPHATAPLPPGGFKRRYNVSFLLQYYKQPANIDAIVDALFNCTADASLPRGTSAELIVNADSRGDAAAWEAAMARTNANGTSFLTVLLSDNLHEVHGYNRAAAVARGEVLLLLQDDSQPPESCAWLADVLDKFRAFPRLGALGLKVGEFWFPNSAFAPAGTDGVGHRMPPHAIMYRHLGVPFQFVSVADFSPFAVRASALAAVGGLDEGMARPGECGIFTDYELCMRLWASGWQVAQMASRGDFRGLGVGGTHVSERVGLKCWERQAALNAALLARRYSAADSAAAFAAVRALNKEHCEPAFEGPPLWERCCGEGPPGTPQSGNACEPCGQLRNGFLERRRRETSVM